MCLFEDFVYDFRGFLKEESLVTTETEDSKCHLVHCAIISANKFNSFQSSN